MSRKNRTKSLTRIGIISANQEKKVCMFCLCETPTTVPYDGPCMCKPHVHKNCLESWFHNTPNECPLCRKDYDPVSETEDELVVPPRNYLVVIFNRRMRVNNEQCKNIKKYAYCLITFLYFTIYVYRYMKSIIILNALP
jgi:hypothetical protein